SRLPNLLWFGLLTGSVWYGSYLLGRRPEPQPLALPFGGEPTVRDYGRIDLRLAETGEIFVIEVNANCYL
ncbi:MAG: hypothetical protein ACTS5Y_07190, partial [Pollutimonas bauzanensis]